MAVRAIGPRRGSGTIGPPGDGHHANRACNRFHRVLVGKGVVRQPLWSSVVVARGVNAFAAGIHIRRPFLRPYLSGARRAARSVGVGAAGHRSGALGAHPELESSVQFVAAG